MRLSGVLLIGILSVLSSCNDIGTTYDKTYLPNSVGRPDELLIIGSPHLLKNGLADTFEMLLMQPFPGLPQYEPQYKPLIKEAQQFGKVLKKYKTIVFVSALDQGGAMNTLIKELIGEQNIKTIQNASTGYYYEKENVWAKPQKVIFILAKDINALYQSLDQNQEALFSHLRESESETYKKEVFALGRVAEVEKYIKEKHSLNMLIPEGYHLSYKAEEFSWVRKETNDLSSSVFIYETTIDSEVDLAQQVLKIRNDLGAKYFQSEIEGSYTVVDSIIPIQQTKQLINGQEVIKTSGLWKMQNDFMGGPFVNYTLVKDNKVLMIDGFVYAPKTKKKKLVKQLETIIKTAF